MKSYAVEVTEPNNPKCGQEKDPALYFTPTKNAMQILRYKDPKKESGWIKALKKDLKTIIESGNLKIKEQTNPNDVVILTTEANKIKLDQDENVDKLIV
jgi:hypothetical protein